MTREEKMKIVINNYFITECSVNTSIREAFEKGFRIGVSKVQPKHGEWVCTDDFYETAECSCCKWDSGEPWDYATANFKFCPNCGANMSCSENPNS